MIQNRNLRKYILYAFGEIVLVVIGILLALQIDSCNDQRIMRAKEIVYLKEIKTNLEQDKRNIIGSIEKNQKKDSAITRCIKSILNASSELEAMNTILNDMPILTEYAVFTQNRVAFDNMLSAESIALITEDSLRTSIATYYAVENLLDGMQERVKQLTRAFVDNTTPLLMNEESIRRFYQLNNIFPKSEVLKFRSNRQLCGDLFGMQRNLKAHEQYLRNYHQNIDALLAQINTYLNP